MIVGGKTLESYGLYASTHLIALTVNSGTRLGAHMLLWPRVWKFGLYEEWLARLESQI